VRIKQRQDFDVLVVGGEDSSTGMNCPNMMRQRKTHFSITFINFSPPFPRGKIRSFDLP
jgi:hypothetical protein